MTKQRIARKCEQRVSPEYTLPNTCGAPTAYVLAERIALCMKHGQEYLRTPGYIIRLVTTEDF